MTYPVSVKDAHHLKCVCVCLDVWVEVMRSPLVINMHRERERTTGSSPGLLLKIEEFGGTGCAHQFHSQAYDIITSNAIRGVLL